MKVLVDFDSSSPRTCVIPVSGVFGYVDPFLIFNFQNKVKVKVDLSVDNKCKFQ